MAGNDLVLNLAGGSPTRDPKKEVIGRDDFVKKLAGFLAYTSVEMSAPRRIGKSWVLSLLAVTSESVATPIYLDLENIHSTHDLVDKLAKATQSHLIRAGAAVGKILEHTARAVKAKDYKFPWKDHLESLFRELNKKEKPVWLLLDEFPLLLNNFIIKDEHQVAIEILDHFRFVRQNYKNTRFVLTGSIGLHWVIEELEKTGWRNPQNDDERVTLGTLELKDAIYLTEGLLRGIGENTKPAAELAEATNGHPFYIQKALGLWKDRERNESVTGFCDRIAQKPEDPFEFNDLDKRLGNYFGRDAKLAKRVIDILSEDTPALPRDIVGRLRGDPEDIKNILDKLEIDGYTQVEKRKYRLHPPLFQRWWKNKRGGLYE